MSDEIWREVPTHAGYWASSTGRIRGPRRVVLRPMRTTSGHLYVLTPLPRRPRKLFVHRAIALAFIGFPEPGQEVRHMDGNPDHNAVENLRWGTRAENQQDRERHGTQQHGEQKPGHRLTLGQVEEIRRDMRSSRVVGLAYGVSHTAVQRIRRGERWRAA
jgi:hypothetical protein